MKTTRELIQLLAADFHVDPATITADSQLADHGIDSLGLVDLMFAIEEHFGIDLPLDVADCTTLGALAALVDRTRQPCAVCSAHHAPA